MKAPAGFPKPTMPRKSSPTLTDAETRVMTVLWNQGPATVADVVTAIGVAPAPAYNTVLTLLRILERKGYVTHAKAGRAFIYRPHVGRTDARRSAIRQLVGRLFDGSPDQLVLNVLEDRQLSGVELDRLRRLADHMPPAPPTRRG